MRYEVKRRDREQGLVEKGFGLLGYKIFRHSVLMLLDNISVALRLSFFPFLALAAAVYSLAVFEAEALPETDYVSPVSGAVVIGILALIVLYLIVLVWVAVGWHRYVLQNIEPHLAWPVWNSERMWAYAGAFLRVIPITILYCFIALLFFLIPAAIFNGGSVSTDDGTFLGFLLGVVVSYISMRLSLVLPAAAVGEFMRVPESWSKTKELSKPIFVAALCVGVLTAIPNLLLHTPAAPIIGSFVYFLVAQWFLLMLGISIMTALYGFVVENRELR